MLCFSTHEFYFGLITLFYRLLGIVFNFYTCVYIFNTQLILLASCHYLLTLYICFYACYVVSLWCVYFLIAD